MYGYFRPYDCGLTNRELKIFNSYYCRLCYCHRIVGGQLSRYLTTFDSTIYSIILKMAMGQDRPPSFPCQKIRKGNMNYFRKDILGLRVARLSFIAFGEKIRDDVVDGDLSRARWMNMLFGKAIAKAQTAESEIQRLFYEGTEAINVLQQGNPTLQTLLDVYGELMVRIFGEFGTLDQKFSALVYALARWLYYVDILCDYTEDFAEHAFNPLRDENCPTIEQYFCVHYAETIEQSRKLGKSLMDALFAVKSDELEWKILYKIFNHALNTVVPDILMGQDVTYHLVRELIKRHFEGKRVRRLQRRLEKR